MGRLNEVAGVIIVVLLAGAVLMCQQSVRASQEAQATAAVAPPTPTPLPIGPLVVSTNPDVVIQEWQYVSPTDPDRWDKFPFSPISSLDPDPEIIEFGVEPEEAFARWREDGFDLVWWDYPCSTQPVVIIEDTTVGLWPNRHIFDLCTASSVMHAFKIEWRTTIPREAWRYEIHDGVPPVTLQSQ